MGQDYKGKVIPVFN